MPISIRSWRLSVNFGRNGNNMHLYASDSPDRTIVPWIIAAIAVAVAYAYFIISSHFEFSLPWWMEAPSILGVYGIGRWLYNTVLWKKILFGFHLSQIPNCNGTWYGPIHSSHNGGSQREGMITIRQTWSKILIEFESSTSSSLSRMASFNITPGPSHGLIYEYTSDPRSHADPAMHAHRGLAFLKLSQRGDCLEGDYYTGRDRGTQGSIKMHRVSDEVLDRKDAAYKYSLTTTPRGNWQEPDNFG